MTKLFIEMSSPYLHLYLAFGLYSFYNVFNTGWYIDGLSLKKQPQPIHPHFIATVLMKLCPCGRYRQLNSVLYPNNHILKSSNIILTG